MPTTIVFPSGSFLRVRSDIDTTVSMLTGPDPLKPLTAIEGQTIYVNPDHIAYLEPFDEEAGRRVDLG